MSYIANLILCPDLQDRLNGYFGCDKASMIAVHETGLTQFLFSPLNTNNRLKQVVAPGNGKIRSIDLIYSPRIPDGDVSTSINRESCVSVTPRGELSANYTLDTDQGVEIEWKIRDKDLIQHCQDNQDYFNQELMKSFSALTRRMDRILASQVFLLKGAFGKGEEDVVNNIKTVATRKPTANGGGLTEDFITEIHFAAMNAGYCANPFIFGFGEIYKAYKLLEAQCCADNGTNVAVLGQALGLNGSFIPDSNIKDVLGANGDFLMLDPGAVQVLTYNAFEGYPSEMSQPTFRQTVVVDPRTGIPYDLQVKYDCGFWHFRLSLAFKAVGVPADQFFPGDRFYGTVGVNEFKITNPA